MVNPKSLKNLKQFKTGDIPTHIKSKGDISLTSALKRYLHDNPTKSAELAAAWVKLALTDHAFAREIWERIDGRVPQPVSGQITGAIEIIVRYDGNSHEAGSSPPETAAPETG